MALPGMPSGKPAGVRCANLTAENLCRIFGQPQRPAYCAGWQPTPEICGGSFEEAMRHITVLEEQTR